MRPKGETMISVREIEITRAEGPSELCGRPHVVRSFEQASALLAMWAVDAPEGGAYDKCDFVVRFDGIDGEYTGRYDLQGLDTGGYPDLRAQVARVIMFAAGEVPSGVDPDHARALSARMDPEHREYLLAIREAVDVAPVREPWQDAETRADAYGMGQADTEERYAPLLAAVRELLPYGSENVTAPDNVLDAVRLELARVGAS